MLMFISVQILQYFPCHFLQNTFRKKNLKNTNVLGSMSLGIRKGLGSREELQDLVLRN